MGSNKDKNIKRQQQLYEAMNTPFMRDLNSKVEKIEDDKLVTVKVPGAGGGLVSTKVPLQYLKGFLEENGQEYNPMQIYTIPDPKVVEQAKSESPDRYADPINNPLNWMLLGGAGAARVGIGTVLSGAKEIGKAGWTGLKTVGQAMTPSTWIGGGMQAAGYQAPNWLLNGADLAASAYFANEAGKDIGKNGLTWKTGINALLSLAPFTRETEAIEGVANTLRRPMSSVSSVVDNFRKARNVISNPITNFGREFNRDIKNTQFINVPVEHVSPNGVTSGSVLDIGEEGIHLSPVGSSTTPKVEAYLLSQGQFPFVRTGTWTFSNNTKPTEVQDVGYFGKGFNPDFDNKVSNGVTNFRYINNFEGQGNTSYLTVEPSFGLQLSKNTPNNASRINWDTPDTIVPEGIKLADGTLIKDAIGLDSLEKYFNPREIFYDDIIVDGTKVGAKETYLQNGREYSISKYPGEYHVVTPEGTQSFSFPTDGNILDILNGKASAIKKAQQFILDSRDNWIQSLDEIPRNIVRRSLIAPESLEDKLGNRDLTKLIDNGQVSDYIKASVRSDIDDVYLSDKYIDRYMKSFGYDPKNKGQRKTVTDILKSDLNHTYVTNEPIFYQYFSGEGGISNTGNRVYGINGNADYDYFNNDWTSVIFHEFGHNLFGQDTPTGKYISSYTYKLLKDNPVEYSLSAEFARAIKPKFREYLDYLSQPNEFRQRIMEGVRYGIKEDLTPEEIYNECKVQGFLDLKKNFTKQYLIKMLGLILGIVPVIVNSKNNDKSS